MALTSGTKLGPYEILSPLGAGGMGEVYRARDTRLGRDVAIKILPQDLSQDAGRAQRFEHEARVLGALNHPNLLAIYDVGTQDGIQFLVSELLDGTTLRQRLMEGPIPARKAVDYGVQIAKGLARAHEKGVVHRDLKPENLFLTKYGRVKILDFGLAKVAVTSGAAEPSTPTMTSATEPGVVMGTVGYMAPEQVRGRAADHRSDIFAFGAVLYEMLTGKRAFHKATSAETMTAILNEDPPVSSQAGQNVSPALHRVLQRCLEKNPEERFQSASDLAFALDAMSDSGSAASGAMVVAERRMAWVWMVAAGIAIAAIATTAAWLAQPSANPVVESVTQLTNDGELKFRGLVTDGTRIYFNEGPQGSLRIAEVSVDGGQTAQVATKVSDAAIDGITADGSAILIARSIVGETPLFLLPVPAGEPRRLGDIQAVDAGLFPDGRVVFSAGAAIYVANKDGSGVRKLADVHPDNTAGPRVSPDAKQIVFSTFGTNFQNGPIYEMAADGTGLHPLLTGGAGGLPPQICCAQWTADGKYLLFQGLSEGRWNLWALLQEHFILRGPAAPFQLSNGPLSYEGFAAGRDIRKIYAVGMQRRGELVRYDAKSRAFVPYVGGISAFWPTFSRDGKWMAYVSYPEHTLWRSHSDGSERLQLTYPPDEVGFAQISPDGNQIAYSTPDQSAYLVSINGGTPKKLAENAQGPNFSPDGNRVVFESVVPGRQFGDKNFLQARIADLGSGRVEVVPGSQGFLGPWMVAPDKLVGMSEDSTKALLLDAKTEKISVLAFNQDAFISWATSPDGKYLYCSTGGSEPKALRIRLADRAVEPIASLRSLRMATDPYVGPQVTAAPDGSVLVTRDIGTQETYALTVKWP
jgi:hypothetical protein